MQADSFFGGELLEGRMSGGRDSRRNVYAEKAAAELSALAERGVTFAGHAFSSILLIKGVLSEAEAAGEDLLAGRDGEALRAALLRLGYAPHDWCAMAACDAKGMPLAPELVAEAIAALSPLTLVACDDAAAELLRAALGDDLAAGLTPGVVTWARGMRVLSLGGFAQALEAGEDERQRAWRWLKQIPPLAEPY